MIFNISIIFFSSRLFFIDRPYWCADIIDADNIAIASGNPLFQNTNITLEIDMRDKNNRTVHFYINNCQEECCFKNLPKHVKVGVCFSFNFLCLFVYYYYYYKYYYTKKK